MEAEKKIETVEEKQVQNKQPKKGGKKGPKSGGASKAKTATDDKITFDAAKNEDFPLWFEQICLAADLIDKRYPVKGTPVMKPYGYYMHDMIMQAVEKEWMDQDIEKAQFPMLIPQDFLEIEKDHVKGFESECFWVTKGGLKELDVKLALRPTSETAMYYMFALWIRSYKDLPLKMHQTCNVFRHETKDTRPLIRVREIFWNEAHTCHATAEEAAHALDEAWRGYLNVITGKLGFHGKRMRRPDWDKFPGAAYSDVMDTVLPDGKVLQTVGTHNLGQKFSKVFDIKFLNKQQKFEHCYMTCFGVSTRVLAAALSIHGDNKGLVLPPILARYHVVIVPIIMKKNLREEMLAKVSEIKQDLTRKGLRVFVDDDDSKKPGDKFYYWEMKGVPVRLEVGPRDLENKEARVVMRFSGEKYQAPLEGLADHLITKMDHILDIMRENAREFEESHTKTCTTQEEMVQWIDNKGGFARIPFFAMDTEAKAADEKVHELCGAEVRGFVPSEEPPAEGTLCLITGKPAKYWAYVAKAY
eukprot:GCRY01001379.1.p1 GENE.GCRY01001379.1~~GCRY01001379.1.p1  ORF type:complete len:528 (-),score=200.74 GCRY01001379.1:254-1837(-)